MTIYVYGASYDLVEIEGHVCEEFPFYGSGHLVVQATSTETPRKFVKVWPHYDGSWTFRVEPAESEIEEYSPMPWPVRIIVASGEIAGAPLYTTAVAIECNEDVYVEWVGE